MSAHDRYRELVAGYALSALEPEDEQDLQAHLAACAPCSRELVAARETAAQLAYAAGQVDPPDSLFASIRAEVLATNPDAFDLPEAEPAPFRGDGVVVPMRRRRLESRAAKLVLAAASVSIAAVTGLGAWNLALQRDNVQQDRAAERVEQALALISAEPGQTVRLTSGGELRAMAVMHDGRMDLVTSGLEPNDPKTTQYVIWGQKGTAAPTYLAAFNIDDADLDTVAGIPTTTVASVPDAIMISREPGQAGRSTPTVPVGPVFAEGRTA